MGFYTTLIESFFYSGEVNYQSIIAFIPTKPSDYTQWLFLIPIVIITAAGLLNNSLWIDILTFREKSANLENLTFKNSPFKIGSILLFLNYLFCSFLFLYVYFDQQFMVLSLLGLLIFLIVPIYLLVSGFIFGYVVDKRNYFRFYNSTVYFQFALAGILLFIGSFFIYYYPNLKIQALATISISFFIVNLVRVFSASIKALQLRFHPFYIILYLCTLEILPFIVFYKALSANFEALIVN